MHTCSLACVVLSQLMQDEFGNTALIAASQEGHLSTAALLLDHGADVNKQNKVRLLLYVHSQLCGRGIEWCAQFRVN